MAPRRAARRASGQCAVRQARMVWRCCGAGVRGVVLEEVPAMPVAQTQQLYEPKNGRR